MFGEWDVTSQRVAAQRPLKGSASSSAELEALVQALANDDDGNVRYALKWFSTLPETWENEASPSMTRWSLPF